MKVSIINSLFFPSLVFVIRVKGCTSREYFGALFNVRVLSLTKAIV